MLLVGFLCSGEELPETNVEVQFRVIPSFKFHHMKDFYSANCPGVTQKLALIHNSTNAKQQQKIGQFNAFKE